jgi:hypothetical protein
LVERVLGKDEVTSSILVNGSSLGCAAEGAAGIGACRALLALVRKRKHGEGKI